MKRKSKMDSVIMDNRQARKVQIYFICKVYAISAVLIALAILQWAFTTSSATVVCWFQRHKYFSLPVTVAGFFVLLLYIFFFKRILKISRWLVVILALFTMELNTIILLRPMLTASQMDIVHSGIATLVAFLLFFCITFIKHSFKTPQVEFFIIWTVRFFVVSEVGLPATYALRNVYVDIIFVSVMLTFLLVLLIYFNVAMGSTELLPSTSADYLLFATLNYCNLLATFSHILMLMARLHKIK